MERLTTNKDVSDIEGMYELAHNSCYIDKDGNARYRDFESDVDARVLTRELLKKYADGDDAFIDDEDFDNQMMEALMYGTNTREGLIALFYRNLWAMADLRERLKAYEDLQDMIGVPFEKFAELCKQEIPEECKNPSKAIILTDDDVDEWHQYKADKEKGLLVKLPFLPGTPVYYIGYDMESCNYMVNEAKFSLSLLESKKKLYATHGEASANMRRFGER